MGWLSLLFMLIRMLPDIIELIRKIIEIFRQDPSKFSAEDFSDLKNAAKEARRSGDKQRLKDLVERLHDRVRA